MHNVTEPIPGVAPGPVQPRELSPDRDEHGSTLRDATLEGVRWIVYGRVAYEILAFASLAILAHLIRPAEYGHVAIALILQSLAIVLTGEGFGNPLVQRKLIGTGHLESATLMSVVSGLLLGAIVFAAAPFVVTPLFGSRTTDLFQLAALLFPIYSFIIVPEAILQRRLDLRKVTIVETAGSIVGAVLSVGLALLGFGGTSIILGTIGGALVTAVILVALVGMPKPRWHRSEAREVTGYGTFASLAGLVYLSVRNVDNVIVGARLGAAQLGLYYRAFALGVNNQLKIGMVLLRVAFPALSRSESPEEMRLMRDRMTRLNAIVVFPLLVLLAITAPKLVPFVFGSHWTLAIVPTQILALAGIATALTYPATPFLLASGHPKAILKLNVATFLVYGAGILAAVPHGLRAVCAAVVLVNFLTMLASYAVMRHVTQVPLRRIWQDSAPAAASGTALAAVAVPLMAGISASGLPGFVVLAVVGIAGAAVYLVTLRLLFAHTFADLALVTRSVLPKARPPHPPSRQKPTSRGATGRRRLALAAALPVLGFAAAYAVRSATLTAPRGASSVRAAISPPTRSRTAKVKLLALAPIHSPAILSVVPRRHASAPPAKPLGSPGAALASPPAAATVVAPPPSLTTPPPSFTTPPPSAPTPSGSGGVARGGTTGSAHGGGSPSTAGGTTRQRTPSSGTGTSSGGG